MRASALPDRLNLATIKQAAGGSAMPEPYRVLGIRCGVLQVAGQRGGMGPSQLAREGAGRRKLATQEELRRARLKAENVAESLAKMW